jgi:hypothetical protein
MLFQSSGFLERQAVKTITLLSTFQKNLVPQSSGKKQFSFSEPSVIIYLHTRRSSPKEADLHQQNGKDPKSRNI